MLSQERIDRTCNRSTGVWDEILKIVRITRKEGNWKRFGYVKNGTTYLEPYVALFLIEMNRLELYFNDVIVSLEQGYSILLDGKYSILLEEYVVYSKFMRTGFFVQKFKNDYIEPSSTNNHNNEVSNEDIEPVYKYLNCLLNNSNTSGIDENVKHSMDSIIDRTKSSVFVEQSQCSYINDTWNFNTITNKRKNSDPWRVNQFSKRRRKNINNTEVDSNSKFDHIFNDFNQVNIFISQEKQESQLELLSGIKFSFDLFFDDENEFRKCDYNIPDRRILILK